MTNKIVGELLKRPSDFLKTIKISSKGKMFRVLGKEPTPTKGEVSEGIKNSHFREFFDGLTDDEIYKIYQKFEKELNIAKNWLLNSKIRAKTFYQLGEQGTATASEIARIISKDPKSVSAYLSRFRDELWVDEPDEVGRAKRYSLSETGLSYFKVATSKGWFSEILKEEASIEETIIRIYYSELRSETRLHYPEEYSGKTPDFTEFAVDYYFEYDPPELWPPTSDLTKEILNIIKSMKENLSVEVKLPKIFPSGGGEFIAIDTIDEDALALVFAAFNFMEKNKLRNAKLWGIQGIKFLTANSYFDPDMPPFNENEGFLTGKEMGAYIKKVLNNFNKKLKKEKVD